MQFPIYLLLDTSGSMSGEPIEAVRQGLKLLLEDLCSDPTVADIAYLSIITFDISAKQLFPLKPVDSVVEPMINADGRTPLGHFKFEKGKWYLVNDNLVSLISPNGNPVEPRIGQGTELKNKIKLALENEPNGRFVEVVYFGV